MGKIVHVGKKVYDFRKINKKDRQIIGMIMSSKRDSFALRKVMFLLLSIYVVAGISYTIYNHMFGYSVALIITLAVLFYLAIYSNKRAKEAGAIVEGVGWYNL